MLSRPFRASLRDRPCAADQITGPGRPGHRRVVMRPRWGADGTLVSQMAGRPPCGTARACAPSLRGRFGGCSTPRGLPGTTRPRFALQARSE